jgi:hypothetical protein
MKFPNLRVTEGQIFKYAADWCLKNIDSVAEAEAEFQDEFQNIIKRCQQQYIGESERSLKERFSEHQAGHSVSDMKKL